MNVTFQPNLDWLSWIVQNPVKIDFLWYKKEKQQLFTCEKLELESISSFSKNNK